MTNNSENNVKYVLYKEISKKRAREYYHANREVINEKNKNRYKSLSPEEKQKRLDYNKEWYHRQSPEKKAELKQKAREYHKDRYNNLMVAVRE